MGMYHTGCENVPHLQCGCTTVCGDVPHLQCGCTTVCGDVPHLQWDCTTVCGDVSHLQWGCITQSVRIYYTFTWKLVHSGQGQHRSYPVASLDGQYTSLKIRDRSKLTASTRSPVYRLWTGEVSLTDVHSGQRKPFNVVLSFVGTVSHYQDSSQLMWTFKWFFLNKNNLLPSHASMRVCCLISRVLCFFADVTFLDGLSVVNEKHQVPGANHCSVRVCR